MPAPALPWGRAALPFLLLALASTDPSFAQIGTTTSTSTASSSSTTTSATAAIDPPTSPIVPVFPLPSPSTSTNDTNSRTSIPYTGPVTSIDVGPVTQILPRPSTTTSNIASGDPLGTFTPSQLVSLRVTTTTTTTTTTSSSTSSSTPTIPSSALTSSTTTTPSSSTTPPLAPPVASTLIPPFAYLGCASPTPPLFFTSFLLSSNSTSNSAEACVQQCGSSKYAALYESLCLCGVDAGGLMLVAEGRCDLQCPGKGGEKCGGRSGGVVRNRVGKRQAPGGGLGLELDLGGVLVTLYGNTDGQGAGGSGGSSGSASGSGSGIVTVISTVYTALCPTLCTLTATRTTTHCGCTASPAPRIPMTTVTTICHACAAEGVAPSTVTLTLPRLEGSSLPQTAAGAGAGAGAGPGSGPGAAGETGENANGSGSGSDSGSTGEEEGLATTTVHATTYRRVTVLAVPTGPIAFTGGTGRMGGLGGGKAASFLLLVGVGDWFFF